MMSEPIMDNFFDTFKEAAIACGLVENDQEYSQCLQEAALYLMPNKLHHLFAMILIFCSPANINNLWQEAYQHMSEDFAVQDNNQ